MRGVDARLGRPGSSGHRRAQRSGGTDPATTGRRPENRDPGAVGSSRRRCARATGSAGDGDAPAGQRHLDHRTARSPRSAGVRSRDGRPGPRRLSIKFSPRRCLRIVRKAGAAQVSGLAGHLRGVPCKRASRLPDQWTSRLVEPFVVEEGIRVLRVLDSVCRARCRTNGARRSSRNGGDSWAVVLSVCGGRGCVRTPRKASRVLVGSGRIVRKKVARIRPMLAIGRC